MQNQRKILNREERNETKRNKQEKKWIDKNKTVYDRTINKTGQQRNKLLFNANKKNFAFASTVFMLFMILQSTDWFAVWKVGIFTSSWWFLIGQRAQFYYFFTSHAVNGSTSDRYRKSIEIALHLVFFVRLESLNDTI